MKTSLVRYMAAVCAIAVFAIVALAQVDGALVGKWSMVSYSDGEPVQWTLTLQDSDGKLTGTLATTEGEAPAKDFTYQGGVIKFKAPYQGDEYDIELKLLEGQLQGTWAGAGNSGKTVGTKKTPGTS